MRLGKKQQGLLGLVTGRSGWLWDTRFPGIGDQMVPGNQERREARSGGSGHGLFGRLRTNRKEVEGASAEHKRKL